MTTLKASILATHSSKEILVQSLHVGCVVSTASTYAAHNVLSKPDELPRSTEIGRGFQGAVFEELGRENVLKREHPGNSILPTNIRHGYLMHKLVAAAFDRFGVGSGCQVQVPRPLRFLEGADLQGRNFARFSKDDRILENSVEMERILPMPKVVRRALVDHTQEPQAAQDLLNVVANKHCLLRTYLGRLSFKKNVSSLRNYPLDLATMESLNVDIHGIADSVGAAFAIMHWGAGVDGDDVEFVLGTRLLSQTPECVQERQVGLFLLDFGQCDAVDLVAEPAAARQHFKGAMVTGDNQLFIPNLVQRPDLYRSFKKGYVRAGRHVLSQRATGQALDVETFLEEYEEYAEDFLEPRH
ncbi:hypothetical protein V2A60_000931 [Cordyceps javanica]